MYATKLVFIDFLIQRSKAGRTYQCHDLNQNIQVLNKDRLTAIKELKNEYSDKKCIKGVIE
jgi:hypothetical protein